MREQPVIFYNDPTIKIDVRGVAFSIRAREYKDVQCVVTYQKAATHMKDESDNLHGGGTRRNDVPESNRLSEPRGASGQL